ncbi:ABC transporter permease [Brachybacterium sp. NBEC-018]|uniref:ABC transporter permease n=1 Tax=Brachybacterium sp. NBEC-018 TaxID=2996004 RepID=UPI00217553F1|nr:ABC transporter permease [Brachybacterium sp. NBEC-018]UVY82705.1 ABC transporter permease [Brachybacterium sp. NBEC-018]
MTSTLPRWAWPPALIGALFVLLPLAAVLVRVDPSTFLGLISAGSSLAALRLSLVTAACSTVLCLLLGVPLALVLSRSRIPGPVLSLLRALLLIPLVLPPVVGGLALLFTVGRQGLLGGPLQTLGLQVAFSTAAVVLAQTFVALPFLVLTLEGALRSAGGGAERAAAALGARPTRVLLGVTLPGALPALASGTVLSFARALGEFGATITVAGSLEGTTRTLPLEIYLLRETDPDAAVALSLLLVLVALVVILLAHRRARV